MEFGFLPMRVIDGDRAGKPRTQAEVDIRTRNLVVRVFLIEQKATYEGHHVVSNKSREAVRILWGSWRYEFTNDSE